MNHAQWNAINGCYFAVKRDWKWNERLIIPFEANNNFQFVLVFRKITICFVERKKIQNFKQINEDWKGNERTSNEYMYDFP